MTDTNLDQYAPAPENVTAINARIDDMKAERLFAIAATPAGVTNRKVYPSVEDDDFKRDRRDMLAHIKSRINDQHRAQVKTYKPVDGSAGVSFKITVLPKSNRGRKPANGAAK